MIKIEQNVLEAGKLFKIEIWKMIFLLVKELI
jgi:hypothetical protein